MDRIEDRIEKREAMRWLARSLAWEDRLAQLRGDAAVLDQLERPAA